MQGKFFHLKNLKYLLCCSAVLLFLTGCSFNSKVLFFRKAFDAGGEKINSDLEKHVSGQVSSRLNVPYDLKDPDAKMDVYYSDSLNHKWKENTAIVWIHGGGWIAGSKEQLANYSKILALKGYTVVAIEYSLAPEKTHPTQVRQANTALGFLTQHAEKYFFNKKKIVIAGDSGGAQIAAQLGIVLTDSSYAKRLGIVPSVLRKNIAGMILHCGTYDFKKATKDKEGLVLRMMLRAYSGHRNYTRDSRFKLGSVIKYIPKTYPPTFISAGNNDILKTHSYELAKVLNQQGVKVDSLFFENNDKVSLGHEYQFNLDDESGKLALERTVKFLNNLE